jgi:hypothetical protein
MACGPAEISCRNLYLKVLGLNYPLSTALGDAAFHKHGPLLAAGAFILLTQLMEY